MDKSKVNWNLDDVNGYRKIYDFDLGFAVTYGDTRSEHLDSVKRNKIRDKALPSMGCFPKEKGNMFAFRIIVEKAGNRLFDVDNVSKLIIDAFCEKLIRKDNPEAYQKYSALSLYLDDNITLVPMLQVYGRRSNQDNTFVEIFQVIKS